jgi:Inner membrane protein YgaP-like, transmembrane domain
MTMTKNVGSIDRALRIIVGVLLLAFAITGVPATGYNWIGWIGVVPLLTAFMGWCPAYTLVGLSTCPLQRKA